MTGPEALWFLRAQAAGGGGAHLSPAEVKALVGIVDKACEACRCLVGSPENDDPLGGDMRCYDRAFELALVVVGETAKE